jgi:replicative DNA helicase
MPDLAYPDVPFDNAVASLKTPPFSREAEQSVLGGLMLNNEAWISVADLLIEEDFYLREHQILFRAIKSLSEEGHPCDPVTLAEWLQKHEQLEAVGGGSYLGLLAGNTPSAANIIAYANIVRERSILRQLAHVGTEIADSAFNTLGRTSRQLLDDAEKAVFEIAELGARGQGGFVKLDKILKETLERVEELSEREGMITGIPTGFTEFDDLTSGLQRSDLIIIAGRPSMGKCITSDSQIVLADGHVTTIKEIYQSKQAQLLTLGSDVHFVMTQPIDFIDDGNKPVFQMTTQSGRRIETTFTHPFLTKNGWQSLSKISVGDKIAVPRKIPVFGNKILKKYQLKLLAYFISNIYEKSIPAIIFQLSAKQLAFFLSSLFDFKGFLLKNDVDKVQLGYCSPSEKLIRQIQHLLLRFGILTTIQQHTTTHSNATQFRSPPNIKQKYFWQLDILEIQSLHIFIDKIGCFSKSKIISKLRTAISQIPCQKKKKMKISISKMISFGMKSQLLIQWV